MTDIRMRIATILQDLNPWWQPTRTPPSPPPVRRRLQRLLASRLWSANARRAYVVYGPRQVGKTVLLRQLIEDTLDRARIDPTALTYFDFSDDRLVGGGVGLRELVAAAPRPVEGGPRVFFLDEVEHAGAWDAYLKQAVDHGRDRLVLTSSASSHLRERGRESGVGRWEEHRLEGLDFGEFLRLSVAEDDAEPRDVLMRQPRLLPRYLQLGGFPESAALDPELARSRLRSDIAERAILRDLMSSGADLARLKDLFAYLVQDSGSVFVARERAQDLGADERTVQRWVALLEETCLIVSLPKVEATARRRLKGRPKLYAADHGLVTAFAPIATPHHDAELRARLVEAVVYRHLRLIEEAEIGYFRVGNDLEVDFVVDRPDGRTAIEITAGQAIRGEKLSRLARAATRASAPRRVLVYGGIEAVDAPEQRVIPLGDALLNPAGLVESA